MAIDPNSSVLTEDDKCLLVDHLMNKVISGISGRDREDVFDTIPSRTIFAGVLQPTRADETETLRENLTGGVFTSTAIGLDFRVMPDVPENRFRLRITPRWSHYYAVFPTWQQAQSVSGTHSGQVAEPIPIVSMFNGTDPFTDTISPTEEQLPPSNHNTDFFEEPDEEELPDDLGRVVIPRVFRRYDVAPTSFVLDLQPYQPTTVSIGNKEIGFAIEQVKTAMRSDPSFWRHLGKPEQRERVLGDASILKSPEAYTKALNAVQGEPISLPEWSAALQVEASPNPVIPDAVRIHVLLANTTLERGKNISDPGLEERSLFDAGIVIEVEGGTLQPFNFLLAPKDYPEQAPNDRKRN